LEQNSDKILRNFWVY